MLKKILLGIIANGAALYGVTYFMPEIRYTGGIAFFVFGGVTMGLINTVLKPILKLLMLPLQIITLGLSLIVLNGIIFWIFSAVLDIIAVADIRLVVAATKDYFIAGFVFGIVNWVLHVLLSPHH